MSTARGYVVAVHADDLFADTTYQRPLDTRRARSMAAAWDRRLAGIVEVSDRGEDETPRYAIIDGQHRWAAAQLLTDPPLLVANVHEGLNIGQEAALFDKLNRQRKQPTPWDHWRARKAAGDRQVLAIDACVRRHGLEVAEGVRDGHIVCISTLEKIGAAPSGIDLLAATLNVAHHAWGDQKAAYEAPILHGLAMVIAAFDEHLDATRLVTALLETAPQRIRSKATMMRDSGTPGALAKLTAIAVLAEYNKQPGPKLNWPDGWKGVLPEAKADNA